MIPISHISMYKRQKANFTNIPSICHRLFAAYRQIENKSKLPLSSDDVKTTVSSESTDDASRSPDNVERLQREAGDGASAVPNSSESTTNVFHKRTKARNGSLFDEDDDEFVEEAGDGGDGDVAADTDTKATGDSN